MNENIFSVSFYDAIVWRSIMLIGILLISLLVANILKRKIPFLRKSLIPNSVLGGILLLLASCIVYAFKSDYLFNLDLFSTNGTGIQTLEILTYHCLAVGFIAMTLRPSDKKGGKGRTGEIINSGITTVCGYLIQGTLGILITVIAALLFVKDLAPGSGILLAFGYGQGTGQALNIGKNFDTALGISGYSSFGLTIAALGFLTASIVGVIYVNYLRRKGRLGAAVDQKREALDMNSIQRADEIPINESVDKLSLQLSFIAIAYLIAYGIMYLIGNVILGTGSNLIGTIYGFNFLFGVLAAVIVKAVMSFLKKHKVIHREYTNTFLLNRISGFAFDLMIVAGICAIQFHLITKYLGVILILGVVGAIATFLYVRFVANKLFPAYENEQFLAFFGMLTGTASTGMILLREADPNLASPASENLVYQNFPAIILGFPILLIAGNITANSTSIASAMIMLAIILTFFVVLNVVLFRKFIFKKK